MNYSESGKLGGKKGGAIWSLICEKRRKDYESNPKTCLFCNSPIPFKKKRSKFCNHSCAARSNKNRSGTGKDSFCSICKIDIERGKVSHESCRSHGKWTPFELLKSDGTKKKRLIQERGKSCERCKNDSWQGFPIILTMDHIDGNPDNGTKENLRLLCWNCHALTPTFGAKNIGNFSNARRIRNRKEKRKI